MRSFSSSYGTRGYSATLRLPIPCSTSGQTAMGSEERSFGDIRKKDLLQRADFGEDGTALIGNFRPLILRERLRRPGVISFWVSRPAGDREEEKGAHSTVAGLGPGRDWASRARRNLATMARPLHERHQLRD